MRVEIEYKSNKICCLQHKNKWNSCDKIHKSEFMFFFGVFYTYVFSTALLSFLMISSIYAAFRQNLLFDIHKWKNHNISIHFFAHNRNLCSCKFRLKGQCNLQCIGEVCEGEFNRSKKVAIALCTISQTHFQGNIRLAADFLAHTHSQFIQYGA